MTDSSAFSRMSSQQAKIKYEVYYKAKLTSLKIFVSLQSLVATDREF